MYLEYFNLFINNIKIFKQHSMQMIVEKIRGKEILKMERIDLLRIII